VLTREAVERQHRIAAYEIDDWGTPDARNRVPTAPTLQSRLSQSIKVMPAMVGGAALPR
jgi:hypothetical protein